MALAAEVGSGRVGRTTKIPLEKKAELAVRAYIRHNYTDYEERLDSVKIPLEQDDFLYREIKAEAQEDVDIFLSQHRRPS